MKNKGKAGILGTIAVLVIYVLLQWTGIISPDSEENLQSTGNSVAWESTQAPEGVEATGATGESGITEADGATGEPTVTEAPQATEEPQITQEPQVTDAPISTEASEEIELTDYRFRNQKLQDSHFEKHGIEMGFETVEDYIEAANKVISNPDALHKLEAEDNDHIYFLEETNEFVVLSQDGYIRTYYIANGGIDYFNRQ